MLAPCFTAKRSTGGTSIPQAAPCQAARLFKEKKVMEPWRTERQAFELRTSPFLMLFKGVIAF